MSDLVLRRIVWSVAFVLVVGAEAQQTELLRLRAPQLPGLANVFFGSSVSLSGEWLIVGDQGAYTPIPTSLGAAYAYRRADAGWDLTQALTGDPSSRFGSIVAVDGNTLAVSSWAWDATSDNADNTGKVSIYELRGTSWELDQELFPRDLKCDHLQFGMSLALDGDVLAVRVKACPRPPFFTQVQVYERSTSGIWGHVDTFGTRMGGVLGPLGSSLAIDGDLIVAGANDPYGSAVVIRKAPQGWYRSAWLRDAATEFGDFFGASVAIAGDTIVVGAPALRDGPSGYASGHAVVYERTGTDQWMKVQRLQPSDPFVGGVDFGGEFGVSVAIDGDEIVVGSKHADTSGFNTGAVYYFKKGLTGWPAFEVERFVSSIPIQGDFVGEAVDLEDGVIVSSAGGAIQGSPHLAVLMFRREFGSSFCDALPNSTMEESRLSIHGSDTALDNASDFHVQGLPPGSLGGLAVSLTRTPERPVFNGNLCLGPSIRLVGSMVQADGEGRVESLIETAPLGGIWATGMTVYLQFWHSDVLGPGLGFSNAVELALR